MTRPDLDTLAKRLLTTSPGEWGVVVDGALFHELQAALSEPAAEADEMPELRMSGHAWQVNDERLRKRIGELESENDALRARLAALEPLCRAAVEYERTWVRGTLDMCVLNWARSPEGQRFRKEMKP